MLRAPQRRVVHVILNCSIQGREDGLKNRHGGCVNLDLLNGASRTKGCYVGQENYTRYVNTVGIPEECDD